MEILTLVVNFLTPMTVVIFGYFLNQRLKSIDNAQWQNRKVTEKRIDLFDSIAPKLNKVFCFCAFLGYWKDISPQEMLVTKRDLDKEVNIYRHLLSEEFYQNYNIYIHLAFSTFTGWGQDAKIRASIANGMADRRTHANYEWEENFSSMFDNQIEPSQTELSEAYLRVMESLRSCIGLDQD